MSVRAGREFLAIPGPTTIPDEVLRAMHRPAVDIYAGPLLALTDSLMRDVATVFHTKGHAYIYVANGHGAWEAALTNVLSRGDKVLVLESGRFAVGWGNNAARLGAEVEVLKGDMRRAVRPEEVTARLRADRHGRIKGRAGGADRHRLGRGERHRGDRPGDARRRPSGAADGRCGGLAGLHEVRDGRVGRRCGDVGLAEGDDDAAGPGLRRGRERARAVHQTAGLRTPDWDWTDREADEHYRKYAGTPPEHLLFGLRAALDLLFQEGLENAFRRHRLLAEAVRRAVGVWAEGGAIGFNISNPRERSDTVTRGPDAGLRPAGDPHVLRSELRRGAGARHRRVVRQGVPHRAYGHVNAPMILGTLSVIEMALAALGVPHGRGGVQAAIDWLAGEARD